MEIEISYPPTEVTVSAGDVLPATAVVISGTTTFTAVAIIDITVSSTGTQTASILSPSSNQYVGGAFTFVRDSGTANITQIVLSEQGSVNATAALSSARIYYETAATCTYDGTETLFGTAASFDASQKATVAGTMAVGTSQVCVYVVLDVSSGVQTQTMEIEISNPSTEVTVSAGDVLPATVVAIAGTTTFVSQIIIDSSAYSTANRHHGSSPTPVFISNLVGYAFYADSPGNCVYSKTLDGGASWGAAVQIDSINTADCIGVAAWYDEWTPGDVTGTYIHIVTWDPGTDDLFYTRLDTATDVLSATLNASGGNQGGSLNAGANVASITKATNGKIYMGVVDNADSYVIKCSASCTAGIANWTEAGSNPFSNDADYLILMPLSGGDILAINNDISANDILSKVYTDAGNAWAGAWTNIDTNAPENTTYISALGATVDRITGDIYLTYAADISTLGTDDDIRTAVYSGGSWITKANILTNDSKGITGAKISIDENTGDIYVLYSARTNPVGVNTANIYWKKSANGMTSWGAEQGPVNTLAGDIYGARINIISDERIYATWFDNVTKDLFGGNIADLAKPVYVQSAYRLFNNSNSTNVGSSLAPQDSPAVLSSAGQAFRLRMLLHVNGGSARMNLTNFKLQFAGKGTGTCSLPNGSPNVYTNITNISTIAYKDNASPADGAALTGNANDPAHGGDNIVNQTYEEVNNFTNSVSIIPANEDGKWDFSLFDNGASAGESYCFRVVKENNDMLGSYSAYPEITTYDVVTLTLSQSAYRFFANLGTTDVGAPLAGLNSSAVTPEEGTPFRLRILIHASSVLPINGENFKLQISPRSGTCDAGYVGEAYSDVSVDSGDIRYYDGMSADGEGLTDNVNDPDHGGDSVVSQTYEEANDFTNSVAAIPMGGDGKWDFSLVNFSAAGGSYCFRAVKSDGSLIDAPLFIPEIGIVPGTGELNSIVYDTGVVKPAYNSITWKGSLPGGTRVRLKMAVSNDSAGPWDFIGSDGVNCGNTFWYEPATPSLPVKIGCYSDFNNKRYFKYQVQLCSYSDCATSGSNTPTINSIIINWSP
jgi:hypothetical protein